MEFRFDEQDRILQSTVTNTTLREAGMLVSMFVDPEIEQIEEPAWFANTE